MTRKIVKATHYGIWRRGNIELPCYVLESGQRVISTRGIAKSLGMSDTGVQTPRLLASKSLKPFITNDLISEYKNPVVFETHLGSVGHGHDAKLLIKICNVVLDARSSGVLHYNHVNVAEQCEQIVRAFAMVGIEAIIDEVTGYQKVRECA